MYILFFLKKITPYESLKSKINDILLFTGDNWVRSNNFMIKLTHNTVWDVPNLEHLKLNQWYFVTCNHQCWSDILVLQRIFLGKIPFIRFFIKKELMWLPVLNGAWWAYDFPILHRHTKEAIEKNPKLRAQDLETTKKMCQKYQHTPVTILNFLEGTRFTAEKHKRQNSNYRYLLNPKTGGFAYAIQAMNKRITKVLDVTIAYSDGQKSFWDFLCGRFKKVTVKVTEREVPSSIFQVDYFKDDKVKAEFKNWVTCMWEEKDQILKQISTQSTASTSSKKVASGSV